jgi:hypothetical protein
MIWLVRIYPHCLQAFEQTLLRQTLSIGSLAFPFCPLMLLFGQFLSRQIAVSLVIVPT